jgi:hypothetical protein
VTSSKRNGHPANEPGFWTPPRLRIGVGDALHGGAGEDLLVGFRKKT